MNSRPAPLLAFVSAITLALTACQTTSPTRNADTAGDDDAPRLAVPVEQTGRTPITAPSPTDLVRTADVVLDRERWVFAGRTGSAYTTPHFVIRTTLQPGTLDGRLPRFVELALLHYTTALASLPMPQRTMETYMMATRPQWEEVTRLVGGKNAPLFLNIGRGGFATDGTAVYWDIGEHDSLAIAAHEGWHQYTQATFRQPLPVWIEEGLATYMEGFRWHPSQRGTPMFLPWANIERFDLLRKVAASDDLMPLDELLSSRPQDLIATAGNANLVYYAQVWALTHFLADGEDGRFARPLQAMLLDAASGSLYGVVAERIGQQDAIRAARLRVGTAVFEAYFGTDLDAIDTAYRAFIQRIVRTGGRDAIVVGRSPLLPG